MSVSFRNVHTLPAYAYGGLSQWLIDQLSPELKPYPHIIFETDEVLTHLRSVVAGPDDFFVRLDVRDFFLSGVHSDLVDAVFMGMPSTPKTTLMKDVLWFLLDHQYVAIPELFDDRLWRTVIGSGMGLPHSSVISDLALLNLAEKSLLPTVHTYGVKLFLRYRDDVLVIGQHRQLFRSFFDTYRSEAAFFEVKVDEFSSNGSVTFLDVLIKRGGDAYYVTHHLKPTVGRPLGEDSLHAPRVHNWPIAMTRRIMLRTTRRVDALAVVLQLIRRFEGYMSSRELIDGMKSVGNHALSFPLAPFDLGHTKHSTLCLVMPYHPVWYRMINRAVGAYAADYGMLHLLRSHPAFRDFTNVRVVWRNFLSAHQYTLAANGRLERGQGGTTM